MNMTTNATPAPAFSTLSDDDKATYRKAKAFWKGAGQFSGSAAVGILTDGGFAEDTARSIVRKWAADYARNGFC